jgi:hypothetical protein
VSHKTQLPCHVLELKCGGLLFDRHKTPLTWRFVVYYCSAVYAYVPLPGFGWSEGVFAARECCKMFQTVSGAGWLPELLQTVHKRLQSVSNPQEAPFRSPFHFPFSRRQR